MKEKLSKIEIVKECQRMMLMNDYSVVCAKIIGDFMKKNLETNKEWYQNNKDRIPEIMESMGLPKEVTQHLREVKEDRISARRVTEKKQ